MLNLYEIQEAIRELENDSATYNNCMKLASLYIVRDELKKKEGSNNYRYYPMYERRNNSSYGYRPMYYENDDLMIKKDMMNDHNRMG